MPLAGTNGLKKTGVGRVVVSGSNSYTGLTEIIDGALQIGASSANLGSSGNSLLLSGNKARLDLGGFATTVKTVTLQSGGITNGTLRADAFVVNLNGDTASLGADLMSAGATPAGLTISGTPSSLNTQIKIFGTNNTYGGTNRIASQTGILSSSNRSGIFYSTKGVWTNASLTNSSSFGPGILVFAAGTTNTLGMTGGSEDLVPGTSVYQNNFRTNLTITRSNGFEIPLTTKDLNFGRPILLTNNIVLETNSLLNLAPHGEDPAKLPQYTYLETDGTEQDMNEYQNARQILTGIISGPGTLSIDNGLTNEVFLANAGNSYTGGTVIRDVVRAQGPVFGSGPIWGKGGQGRLVLDPLVGEDSAKYTLPNALSIGPKFRIVTPIGDGDLPDGSGGTKYVYQGGDNVTFPSVSDADYDSWLIKDGAGTLTLLNYPLNHRLTLSNGEVRMRPSGATNELSGPIEGSASSVLSLSATNVGTNEGVLWLTGQRAGPSFKSQKVTNANGEVIGTNQILDQANYSDYANFYGTIEIKEGVLFLDANQPVYPTNNYDGATNTAYASLNANLPKSLAPSGRQNYFPNLSSLTIRDGGILRLASGMSSINTNSYTTNNFRIYKDVPGLLLLPPLDSVSGANPVLQVGNNNLEIANNLGSGSKYCRWTFGQNQYRSRQTMGSVYLSRKQGNTHLGTFSRSWDASLKSFVTNSGRVIATEIGNTLLKIDTDAALGSVTNVWDGVSNSVITPSGTEPIETGVLYASSGNSTLLPSQDVVLDRMVKIGLGSCLTLDTSEPGNKIELAREVYGATFEFTGGATNRGGLAVVGGGTVELSASNSFCGDVRVDSGASLLLSHRDALGTLVYTNNSGGELTNTLVLNGGTLKLYTSGTVVQGGVLALTADSQIDLGNSAGYGKILFKSAAPLTNKLRLVNYNNAQQLSFLEAPPSSQLANIIIKRSGTNYQAKISTNANSTFSLSPDTTQPVYAPPSITPPLAGYFSVTNGQTNTSIGSLQAYSDSSSPNQGGTQIWSKTDDLDPAWKFFDLAVGGQLSLKAANSFFSQADYYFLVTVVDNNGSDTAMIRVTVTDSGTPVISLLGPNPLVLARGSAYVDPGALVRDDRDLDKIIYGSPAVVNTSTNGTTSVKYNATDSMGNRASEVIRSVIVTDPGLNFATNSTVGSTPAVLGVNAAHFVNGQNTPGWLFYSGARGLRIFADVGALNAGLSFSTNALTPEIIASLRTNLSPTNANYTRLDANAGNTTSDNNTMRLKDILQYGKDNSMAACLNLTASDLGDPGVVANQQPIWHFYYLMGYWAARNYGVERFQIWNEPDGAVNFTNKYGSLTNYLTLMRLASSALQCALLDVNRDTGTDLAAKIRGPVNAGHATSDLTNSSGALDFGGLLVKSNSLNLTNPLATTASSTNRIIEAYDYHDYGEDTTESNAENFYKYEGDLQNYLADNPDSRIASTVISEFNTHTGSGFRDTNNAYAANTLDTDVEARQFGLICYHLLRSGVDELYSFKFGQTGDKTNVAKNGFHYVGNSYSGTNRDVGGITLAGEVWRMVNKGFAPGRSLYLPQAFTNSSGSSTNGLYLIGSRSSEDDRILFVNAGNAPVTNAINGVALGAGRRFAVETVSSGSPGSVTALGTVAANGVFVDENGLSAFVQPANSVSLITVSRAPNLARASLSLPVDADTELRDITGSSLSYGTLPVLQVKNSASDEKNRSVALLRFVLPNYLPPGKIKSAYLSVSAFPGTNGTVSATNGRVHVYGLPNCTNLWKEADYQSGGNTATWSSWSNYLKQGKGKATNLSQNVIKGMEAPSFDASNRATLMLGQMQVDASSAGRCMVDVTPLLRAQTNTNAYQILLARELRFNPYRLNSGSTSDTKDLVDNEAFAFFSREGAGTNEALQPRLVLVTEKIAPTNLVAMYSTNKTAGNALTIGANVVGDGDLTYRWKFTPNGGSSAYLQDNNNFSNTTSASLRLLRIGTNNIGTYSVEVSNGDTTNTFSILELTNVTRKTNAIYYGSIVDVSSSPTPTITINLSGSNQVVPISEIATSLSAIPFSIFSPNSDIANVDGSTLVIRRAGVTALVLSHPGDEQYLPMDGQAILLNVTGDGGSITPAISLSTSSLAGLTTTYGSPSTNQSFTVTGSSLTNNLTVAPPAGFEVSTNETSGFTNSLPLAQTNGTLSNAIFVRLAARASAGTYSNLTVAVTSGSASNSVSIADSTVNRRPITVGALATNTVYGDTDPTLTFTNAPLLFADTFIGNITRAAGANAGTYAITQGTLTNPNYDISFVTNTFTITPKTLTIGGLSGSNRVYNGTTNAAVTGTAYYVGLVNRDTHSVSDLGVVWSFATKNLGTNKLLSPSPGFSAPSSNYTITQPTLSADITAAPLTITAVPVTKTVGTALSGGSGSIAFTSSGLVSGDLITSVTITYGSGANAGDAAGIYTNAVVPSAATGTGLENYSITYGSANLTVQTLAKAYFGELAATNLGPDGVSLLLRYAYGGTTNGNMDRTLMPASAIAGSNLVLTYYARTNDTNLSVLPVVTTNVNVPSTNWLTNGVIVSNVSTVATNGTILQKRTASVPTNAANRQFLRLRVELKP